MRGADVARFFFVATRRSECVEGGKEREGEQERERVRVNSDVDRAIVPAKVHSAPGAWRPA